jgi:hypothetical protein
MLANAQLAAFQGSICRFRNHGGAQRAIGGAPGDRTKSRQNQDATENRFHG